MGSFLPYKDNDLLAWAANAAPKLTASPLVFGITAPEAATFEAAYEAFAESMTIITDPTTRTRPAITTKKERRKALRLVASNISKKVQGTASVTDAQKQELGLNVRAESQRWPVPDYAPSLDVKSVSRNTVLIGMHGDDGNRRGKPALVASAQVYSYVGANPPTSSNDWLFQGAATRIDKVLVAFDPALPTGTKVWLCAAFANERNQPGPACDPVGVVLMGNAALPTAAQHGGNLPLAA